MGLCRFLPVLPVYDYDPMYALWRPLLIQHLYDYRSMISGCPFWLLDDQSSGQLDNRPVVLGLLDYKTT